MGTVRDLCREWKELRPAIGNFTNHLEGAIDHLESLGVNGDIDDMTDIIEQLSDECRAINQKYERLKKDYEALSEYVMQLEKANMKLIYHSPFKTQSTDELACTNFNEVIEKLLKENELLGKLYADKINHMVKCDYGPEPSSVDVILIR